MMCSFKIFTPAAAALLSLLSHLGPSLASQPVPLASGIHHLAASPLVSSTSDVYVALGALSKDLDHPIVVPEYAWEAAIQFYTDLTFVPANASYNGKAMWLLYYSCSDAVLFYNPIGVCVAESADGVTWQKPLLPYFPYTNNGTQPPVNTNIIFYTASNTFHGQVMLDQRPGNQGDPSRRFTMAYEGLVDGVRYPYVAYSPDGLQWTPNSAVNGPTGKPFIDVGGWSDTMTSFLWDSTADRYICYGRLDLSLPNATTGCSGGYASERWVLQSSFDCPSPDEFCDFNNPGGWSNFTIAVGPGYPDPHDCTDSYNPAGLFFPDAAPSGPAGARGAGGLHILLPSSFWHFPRNESGAPDERAGGNDGVMDIRLALSRDPMATTSPSLADDVTAPGTMRDGPPFATPARAVRAVTGGFPAATPGSPAA